ncbi:MAG: hypothetical protein DCC58_06845 [Chloroflexi bacterium]|nr:MAG: hypothetical protein DCC58_06845 [Chloroflexota bacterium]
MAMHAADPVVGLLLNPGSVAIVGASEDLGKFGGRALHLLLRHGFRGQVYPVNPNRAELFGLPAYPSISAIGNAPDVALLAIPRRFLRDAILECAQAGVRAAIIITSQFAETGEQGARDERELVAIASAAGMRLLGPNCLGLFSPANGVVLTTSPALDIDQLRAGSIGLTSQSGALMATIFDRANDLGLAFSHCVSVGNQADLEAGDIVEYLIADPATRVICSYVEGFARPERIVALAEAAQAAGKPWLMVKAGRTAAGERAAHSHTASLAGSYAVLEAVARDSGIVLLDDPDAMVLAAGAMARFDCQSIHRVAIITTSGGGGAIAADRLSDAGIPLAQFAPQTAAALDPLYMPGQASNPVDLGGRREGEAVSIAAATLDAIAADPQVDLLLCAMSTAPAIPQTTADLADAAARSGKPFLFFMWPGSVADGGRARLLERNAPFADRLDDCVRALRAWSDWSRWRERGPAPAEPRPTGIDSAQAAALLAAAPTGPLAEAETKALLAAYGVPVNPGHLAATPEAAVAAAEQFGYPVVLKLATPNLVHKSDAGAVLLGLADAAAVRAGWAQIATNVAAYRPGTTVEQVLVQRMETGDLELIIGGRVDPQFGPVVLVGAGGVLVELLADVQLARAPLGPQAASVLLQRLRSYPLLTGLRGRPALDSAAVADTISRVSWLIWEQRERLLELDVNPLLVRTSGVVAVDARGVAAPPNPPLPRGDGGARA